MQLPFLSHLPPGPADVALERVRQLLVASEEIRKVVAGGEDGIETVYWFNPNDERNGPVCQVGLQPAGPDLDGPLAFSESEMNVLIRLRFRWSDNWGAAYKGKAIPLRFTSTAGQPVNAVPVPRTMASWSAAVMRALRAEGGQKLTVQLDGAEVQIVQRVTFGPHAFGVEIDTSPDGGAVWYNADTVATYTLMSDFRTGALWNLRG